MSARRADDPVPRPAAAPIVAVSSLLLSVVFLPLLLVVGSGMSAYAASDMGLPGAGAALMTQAILGIVAVCLIGGAIGLLLGRPWGWWASISMHVFFLLIFLKLLRPFFHIRWEHPRATEVAVQLGFTRGIPILVSVFLIALLLLPSMRRYYRVTQREVVRRRVAGRPTRDERSG